MIKIKHLHCIIHFQTDGVDNYWNWIEGTILPSLSSSSRDWAKGCHPLEQYTIDCDSRLVGGARIRQLRVSPGTFQTVIYVCNEEFCSPASKTFSCNY